MKALSGLEVFSPTGLPCAEEGIYPAWCVFVQKQDNLVYDVLTTETHLFSRPFELLHLQVEFKR